MGSKQNREEEKLERQYLGQRIRDITKETHKKQRWIKLRMWTSVFMARYFPDRNCIPSNMGNSILIGNNQLVTKNSLTSFILLTDFSAKTPVGFLGDLQTAVQDATIGYNVHINMTVRTQKYAPDLNAGGMKSRLSQWNRTLSNSTALDRTKMRAAKLLHTYDVCKRKEPMVMARICLVIRADKGKALRLGTKEVCAYLDQHNIAYKPIKSNLRFFLKYFLLLSHQQFMEVKDIPYTVHSMDTLAQLLPLTKGWNDHKGVVMGMDKENNGPYLIDLFSSAKAKNILTTGESGYGKTFLVQNWSLDGLAHRFVRGCFMDLKGNEFYALVKAFGGISLSMKESANQYVNLFKWIPCDSFDRREARIYCNSCMGMARKFLITMANYPEADLSDGMTLIDEFVKSIYRQIGATPANMNTWDRTNTLNPFVVFDYFKLFASTDIRERFGHIVEYTYNRFSTFMSRSSTYSHMWEEEFSMEDIHNAKALHFDFGMLAGSREFDPVVFKLKLLFMRYIKDDYTAYNKSLGLWTWTVLEEAQIASAECKQMYKEDITLRRAQNQITIMLANSISGIMDDPDFAAILDNINMFCLGVLNKSSRDYVTEQFSLHKHREVLDKIAEHDPSYENTFVFINKYQPNAPVGIIKALVPDKVVQGKIFKNVDVRR